ncbi:MAG: addiction module protein [Kiritimatiellaeota bacterium]|nr:addiction module protein [Kiritimatiellota bacterium]
MTVIGIENILKMPVERRILLLEDVWDSIRSEKNEIPVPDSHKRELVRRFKKYQNNPSALISGKQLKDAVNLRG